MMAQKANKRALVMFFFFSKYLSNHMQNVGRNMERVLLMRFQIEMKNILLDLGEKDILGKELD
jgi:hypothetical protein